MVLLLEPEVSAATRCFKYLQKLVDVSMAVMQEAGVKAEQAAQPRHLGSSPRLAFSQYVGLSERGLLFVDLFHHGLLREGKCADDLLTGLVGHTLVER